MNVVSVRGGKTHLADTDSPVPFPLCGSASRNTATRFTTTAADVDCRECSGILDRRAERLAREAQGETMTGRSDVNTPEGTKVVEQIDANIERAVSLAEAENEDGLAALDEETSTLIASLSGKGSIAIKKDRRAAWAAAIQAQPQRKEAAKQASEGVVAAKTWDQYEGVQELVTMGAEKVAEGVRLHRKTADVAKDIAAVIFDMWTRMPNKQGLPDIKGNGDPAKKAAGELYRLAGEGFERNHKNEDALDKLQRSVQSKRTDVRAAWLRSLDEDTTDAAEARALFGTALDDKPEDMDVSEFVATKLYNSPAMLKGEGEKALERYYAKQKALEAGDSSEAEPEELDTDPDEELREGVKRLQKATKRIKVETFEKASEDAKNEVRTELEELYNAIKSMITATL